MWESWPRQALLSWWRRMGRGGDSSALALPMPGRSPETPTRKSAAVEESFGHRVDDRHAVGGDGVDAGLDLREGTERLLEQVRRIVVHGRGEVGARYHPRDQAERVRLGRRVAMAAHDDLLGARRPHEADEARG